MVGRLYAGTSGFSYPAWAPRFYPTGLGPEGLLAYYASRLSACELNNTYYRRPTAETVRTWLSRTPADFRFAVKAKRGASVRAMLGDDPRGSVAWLTEPLLLFGERIATGLLRVPAEIIRTEDRHRRLAAVIEAWPESVPLAVELKDASWQVDETFALLEGRGAVLCLTEVDGPEQADVRVTGRFLYLRLRRSAYESAEIDLWATRLVPFLESGMNVFAFFRHDETGLAAARALELVRRTDAAMESAGASPT